jgi:hypothetical protein
MRLIVILLCLFGWFKPVPFEIVQADHQLSMGGRRESGIANNFIFKMVAKYDSDKMQLNEIWIDTIYFPIRPYKQNADLSFSQNWQKGDTIQFRVTTTTFPDGSDKNYRDFGGDYKKLPKEYEGDALLGYKIKGKQHYFVVKEIRELLKQINP